MTDPTAGKFQRFQAEMQTLIDEDAVAEQEPRLNPTQRFAHFWILVGRNFLRNRCPVRASALAYTTLLALVPLLAVSISVATLFLPRDEEKQKEKLLELIDTAIRNVAPSLGLAEDDAHAGPQPAAARDPDRLRRSKEADQAAGSAAASVADENTPDRKKAVAKPRAKVADEIVKFVGNIRFGTIGATAMAGLLFVAISLMRTVEAAFNDIWGVARGRSWFMSIVLYWAVITLGPVVVLLAKGANYVDYLPFMNLSANWGQKTLVGQMLSYFSFLFPIALMGVAFAALYLWMPNTRVQWQAALVGGLVAAALWTLNGRLSAFYNSKVVTYNAIYGSLGIVPLFLVGMYFSWIILLFGSQTAYVFQHRHAYLQERRAGRVHQQGREFIALRLMTHLGERFLKGEKPANASQLADRFGVPPKLTKDLLQGLVAADLVVEVAGVETGYAPGRPLAQITARDVLRALRAGQGHDLATNPDAARTLVKLEFDGILAAEHARAGGVAIEDLARRTLAAPPPSSSSVA